MTMQPTRDEWTDRLSEYLDDELTPDERRAIEAHVAGCERCAKTLEELRRVVERARSIPPRAPAADLWSGIAERIDAPRAGAGRVTAFRPREPRRFSFTLPQLAAAGILLALLSGGLAWQLRTSLASRDAGRADLEVQRDPNVRPTMETPADAGRVEPVGFADAQYDSAVADLQRTLQKGRGHLDPATIAIVEQNLKIIDRAIEQARQAVMDDPGNSYLTGHLVETRRKKLDLLRRAAALASETN